MVGVVTHSLELYEEEEFLRATLKYTLDINGEKMGNCTLVLKVQSCEETA